MYLIHRRKFRPPGRRGSERRGLVIVPSDLKAGFGSDFKPLAECPALDISPANFPTFE
jgi:hypothetical protein